MNMAETVSDFSKLLEALDGRVRSGGAGIETGVHEGRATAALIAAFDPVRIALIDPWVMAGDYQNKPFAHNTTAAALQAARGQVIRAYGDRKGVEIHALPSHDALAKLEDDAFDWVYLDGCKYYPELLADLERCITLLKPGGVILGAGLDWAPQLGFPVRAALRALTERLDTAPELVEQGTCFALMLPDHAVLLPKVQGPRHLVISTMKNEAPFILEWVAHYKAIGFTDFLVYTNDCDDATVPLLDRLTERGILRHEPNQVLRRGPHKSALKYAQDHWMVAQADWVLICDVDEFLNLQAHVTIQDYMDSLPSDTDMVTFPWQVFGSGGQIRFRDQPVTEQFTRCEAAPGQGGVRLRDIKTMFRRASEVHRFGLHRPRFRDNAVSGFVWRTPNGEDISDKMNNSAAARVRWPAAADSAYMNHYPIRAVESYMMKKLRGRANHVNEDLGEEYFYKWDRNYQADTSIVRFAPAMVRELDVLLEDADTARLHAEGVRQFETRIAELKENHVYRALYQTICASLKRSKEPTVGKTLPVIAALWMEGPLSFLEQLCLKSYVDVGHKVILYQYGIVTNVPDGIEIADAGEILPRTGFLKHSRTGSPAIHADLFRYKLLEKFDNVIWADTDAYCMKPFEMVGGHYHGWGSDVAIFSGVLALPKDSATLHALLEFTSDEFAIPQWYNEKTTNRMIKAKEEGNPIHVSEQPWGVWGPQALTYFLQQTGEDKFSLPTSVLYPFPFNRRNRMLLPNLRVGKFLKGDTASIHFYGRRMRERIVMMENGVPHPDSLLGQLMEKHGINAEDAPLPSVRKGGADN
jgi:SAM-dependent methyltransferase